MRRIIITILFLISFVSFVISQPQIDNLIKEAKLGETYVSMLKNVDENAETFYLEIIPPIFEDYYDTIEIDEIKDLPAFILLKPSYSVWILKGQNPNIWDCLEEAEAEKGLILTYENIDEKYLNKENIDTSKRLIIAKSRLIDEAIVKIYDDKKLASQAAYLLPKGEWTDFYKMECHLVRSEITVSQIQQALKDKNYYHGEIDGVLNENTRAALVKFQKDNVIPSCFASNKILLIKLGLIEENK